MERLKRVRKGRGGEGRERERKAKRNGRKETPERYQTSVFLSHPFFTLGREGEGRSVGVEKVYFFSTG